MRQFRKTMWFAAGVFLSSIHCSTAIIQEKAPIDLQVEGVTNPIAIDQAIPAFSWKMDDTRRGAAQSGYRILVASSTDRLVEGKADLWDSGKVTGDQSLYIPYGGKLLSSGQAIVWTVRIWNEAGRVSPYGEIARFQMGLLDSKDWTAKWIRAQGIKPENNELAELWMHMAAVPHIREDINAHTRRLMGTLEPSPLLRREFKLPTKPVRATLHVSGLGYYESHINGCKVGDGLFEPAMSHYPERTFYNTFDVTGMLRKGGNALGLMLGDGWYYEPLAWASFGTNSDPMVYGRPVAIAQLVIELENGETVTVVTNEDWKSAPGPILKNHYYIGECYDAKAFPDGWDQPGFNDSGWLKADQVDEPVTKRLQAQDIEPEKVIRRINPISVSSPRDGIWVFDMGELLVGFPEIHVPAGQVNPIVLRFAEWVIDPELSEVAKDAAELNYDNLTDPKSTEGMIAVKVRGMGFFGRNFRDKTGQLALRRWFLASPTLVYQSDGDAAVWSPRFAVFPYRYIEVQGLKEEPGLDFLEGLVVHTAMERTGSFSSSEPLYPEILEACLKSTLYNTHGMTWDNPCERAQQPMMHAEMFPQGAMNYDYRATAEKLMDDFRYLRGTRDDKTLFIPYTMRGEASQGMIKSNGAKQESPEVELPWQLYLYYGDKRILEEHFPYIEKFFNHFYGPKNPYKEDEWLRGGGYVEHLASYMCGKGEPVPIWDGRAYHSTYLYELARKTAKIANIIGKPDRANYYNQLADNIRQEFKEKFPLDENKGYGDLKLGSNLDSSLGNMIGDAHAVSSGIVADKDRSMVANSLARIMTERYDHHPSGEAQSMSRILRVLSDNGNVDLAAEWMKRTTHPSYGYMLSFGHKTIWEGFANLEERPPHSIVQNEFQTGGNWFQESLCGVQTDPEGPGMKHFFLVPRIPHHVASAGTEFENSYGMVRSAWSQTNGIVTWNVSVPANSTATAVFPEGVLLKEITESGKPLNQVVGIIEKGSAEVDLLSGSYQFSFKNTYKSR